MGGEPHLFHFLLLYGSLVIKGIELSLNLALLRSISEVGKPQPADPPPICVT